MTHEGFVLSSKHRQSVFQELAAGESDPERIAKKHHIIDRVVDQVLEEFEEREIVEVEEGAYALTGEGESIAQELKKNEQL